MILSFEPPQSSIRKSESKLIELVKTQSSMVCLSFIYVDEVCASKAKNTLI